jgi:hypothetical protein
MESDLRALIIGDSAVNAMVGDRVYPLLLPQQPTLPAIAYQRISSSHVHSHSGVSGYCTARVQFACYAQSFAEAASLGDKLRAAIDAWAGVQGATSFAGILLLDERDAFEEEALSFRKDLDFEVQYQYAAVSR